MISCPVLLHLGRVLRRALIVFPFVAALAAYAATVEYAYDENGRLVVAYASNGDSAQYVYDAAGNITQINRVAAGTLAVFEFIPKTGPIGTQVTIWGSGFSATPSLNTVTFNGVVATVVSAAPNKLVVTVPSGAANGNITVTVGGGAASTANAFAVSTAADCASRFAGFSPAIGVAGSAAVISGASLDAGPAFVLLNGASASVQTATSSALTVSVPAAASSGELSISMPPSCGWVALGDFFVPPSPFTASDIGATGRLTVNGTAVTATLATGKKGLYVFDSLANVGTALRLSGSTLGSVTVDIRAADGTILSTSTFSTATGTVGPLNLPVVGGFSIFINPGASASGSITMQLSTPDLAISNPAAGTISENQNGTFNLPVSFTVTNLGASAAPPPWND
jgi:hypothetical protein